MKSISKQAAQTVLIKNLPDKDIAKLRHELDTVNFHVEVFEEIITGLETNRENDEDWRLLLVSNMCVFRVLEFLFKITIRISTRRVKECKHV